MATDIQKSKIVNSSLLREVCAMFVSKDPVRFSEAMLDALVMAECVFIDTRDLLGLALICAARKAWHEHTESCDQTSALSTALREIGRLLEGHGQAEYAIVYYVLYVNVRCRPASNWFTAARLPVCLDAVSMYRMYSDHKAPFRAAA